MSQGAQTCRQCGAALNPDEARGLCPACLLRTSLAEDTAEPDAQGPVDNAWLERNQLTVIAEPGAKPQRLGDYELLEEIGRGGMGIIYRARQTSLDRLVAVKTILTGPLASPDFAQRFQTEAHAAAVLDHPHIVPIYEVGNHRGQPFYSMRLVAGRNLAQELKATGAMAPHRAAELVATVARAVHYAHQRGILHRDLKPSNILLDAQGEPHIADFGLARRTTGDSDLTLSGAVMGTPSYASPEQAAGKARQLTTATDIYSLGAVLYFLLSRRPPFQADSTLQLLRMVEDQEAEPPSRINPAVDRDLDTICLKRLEKDPQRRYASADALANDLERWLRHEPILARSGGAWAHLAKWVRRKPALAAALGAATVLLFIAVIGISWQWRRAERHAAEEAQQSARAAASLHRLQIQRAREFFAGDNPEGALALLAALLRRAPTNQMVAEWILNELTHRSFALPIVDPLTHQDEVYDARFSGDGRLVLTVARNNTAHIWDAVTGQSVGRPLSHGAALKVGSEFQGGLHPLFAQFSPDGKRVVTASFDNTARVWDAATGEPMLPPLRHSNWVCYAQFSPDGALLATACKDGTARLWNVANGAPVGTPLQHDAWVNSAEFSPDGLHLVTASDDGTTKIWDVRSFRQVGETIRHSKSARYATFSPDGRRVGTASADGTAGIWDAATGLAVTPPLRHENQVTAMAFSPDGRRVATGSFDRTARIWDAGSGRAVGLALAHRNAVRSVSFSPDGFRVVTASPDGTARIWDARTGSPLTEPIRHGAAVWSARFNPDGTTIVTASSDKTVRILDARPGAALDLVNERQGRASSVVWSDDGRWLLCVGRWVSVIDAATGLDVAPGPMNSGDPATAACFSPDSQRVALATEGRRVSTWDLRAGRVLMALPRFKAALLDVRFDVAGARLVTASADGTVLTWDSRTGKSVGPRLAHPDEVSHAVFSPDGTTVATACSDGKVRLWNPQTGSLAVPALEHANQVLAIQFSPDGRRLATASLDGHARVWIAATGVLEWSPFRHRGPVRALQFNPKGTLLVTAADDTAQIWDLQTGRPLGEPLRHSANVSSVSFSADGERLVTACSGAGTTVWDVRTSQPVAEVFRHGARPNSASLSPDGLRIAEASSDRRVRVSDMFHSARPAPDWLPSLAEAIAGHRLVGEQVEGVSPAELSRWRRQLSSHPGPDDYSGWARWFFGDRSERPTGPAAKKLVRELVAKRVDAGFEPDETTLDPLIEAMWLAPRNAQVYAQAARVLALPLHGDDPQRRATIDWWLRQSLCLGAADSLFGWARAQALELSGEVEAAVGAMIEASARDTGNIYFWHDYSRLLEKSGRVEEAIAAMAQAIGHGQRQVNPAGLSEGAITQLVLAYRDLLERHHRPADMGPALALANRIPPRDPRTSASALDLGRFYNAGLHERWLRWSGHAGDLKDMAPGRKQLLGVEFDVRGLVQLSGLSLRRSARSFPDRMEGIPVGRPFRRIFFLHATEGQALENTHIGCYRLRFADGELQEIPILYGRDVLAWDREEPPGEPGPIVAWDGRSQTLLHARVFLTTWNNPRPDVAVNSIDFLSAVTASAPFLVAMTVEP